MNQIVFAAVFSPQGCVTLSVLNPRARIRGVPFPFIAGSSACFPGLRSACRCRNDCESICQIFALFSTFHVKDLGAMVQMVDFTASTSLTTSQTASHHSSPLVSSEQWLAECPTSFFLDTQARACLAIPERYSFSSSVLAAQGGHRRPQASTPLLVHGSGFPTRRTRKRTQNPPPYLTSLELPIHDPRRCHPEDIESSPAPALQECARAIREAIRDEGVPAQSTHEVVFVGRPMWELVSPVLDFSARAREKAAS